MDQKRIFQSVHEKSIGLKGPKRQNEQKEKDSNEWDFYIQGFQVLMRNHHNCDRGECFFE